MKIKFLLISMLLANIAMAQYAPAGDITEAVNEAAMTAAYNDVPISQKILVDVLKYKNPTYSTKTRIGFHK